MNISDAELRTAKIAEEDNFKWWMYAAANAEDAIGTCDEDRRWAMAAEAWERYQKSQAHHESLKEQHRANVLNQHYAYELQGTGRV